MRKLIILVACLLASGCTAIRVAAHNERYDHALKLEAINSQNGDVVGARMMVNVGKVLDEGRGVVGAWREDPVGTAWDIAKDTLMVGGTTVIGVKAFGGHKDSEPKQATYDVHDINGPVTIVDHGGTVNQDGSHDNGAE